MKKNRIPKNDNPFVRWLLGYVDMHDVNLTALSLKAGLSSGSLRSVVNFPSRRPSLETCVRLSAVPVMSYFRLIFSKRRAKIEVNTHLIQKLHKTHPNLS